MTIFNIILKSIYWQNSIFLVTFKATKCCSYCLQRFNVFSLNYSLPRDSRGLCTENIPRIPKPRITSDNCNGHLNTFSPFKITKSMDNQGQNPQILNLVHNLQSKDSQNPRITYPHMPHTFQGCLYFKNQYTLQIIHQGLVIDTRGLRYPNLIIHTSRPRNPYY